MIRLIGSACVLVLIAPCQLLHGSTSESCPCETGERRGPTGFMNAASPQNDPVRDAASRLSSILQRLVAANLFPTEYVGTPPVTGLGIPLSGLPADVDARLFTGPAGGTNLVRVHDSFSGTDHWYTQGAIEAAGIGERIGRTWGTARWPQPVSPPGNISGDRDVAASGEDIPVPDQVKGAVFRLFRSAEGDDYVRVTDPAGRAVWVRAALIGS